MAMSKVANVNLESTAQYQSVSGLNVQFWNQDTNTAVLKFNITRNGSPLSLSNENVDIFIKLESGENYVVDSSDVIDGGFDIIDEINGIVYYTIPHEFISVAEHVTGQVYVTTKDREETVVQRKFTFEVAKDLLSTIPGTEKLKEIRLFSQLRDNVSEEMNQLNEDFANMNNYVDAVNQASSDGVTSINNLTASKTNEYNDNHNLKMGSITTTGENYTVQFANDKQYVDNKIKEFEQKVLASDVILSGDADNWQKYKMTNDDGSRIYLPKDSFTDITALSPGLYETTSGVDSLAQGFPQGHGDSTYSIIDVTVSNGGRRQIKVVSSYNSETWVKYIHTDSEDRGWKEIPVVDDVGSLETVNGSQSKANTAENNAKQYTDSKIDTQHNVLFSGSVVGVGNTVNLNGSMNDYEYIIVSGDVAGNDFSQIIVPSIVGSIVNIQALNLRDTDGMLLGVYEVRLEITSTNINITHDIAYDAPSDTGSGPNRNAFTIARVEGVHKK